MTVTDQRTGIHLNGASLRGTGHTRRRIESVYHLTGQIAHCDCAEHLCRVLSRGLIDLLPTGCFVFVALEAQYGMQHEATTSEPSGVVDSSLLAGRTDHPIDEITEVIDFQPPSDFEETGRLEHFVKRNTSLWCEYARSTPSPTPTSCECIKQIDSDEISQGFCLPISASGRYVGMISWLMPSSENAIHEDWTDIVLAVSATIAARTTELQDKRPADGHANVRISGSHRSDSLATRVASHSIGRAGSRSSQSEKEVGFHDRLQQLAGLLGDSPQMELARSQINRVARASHPVLITGESGVGKELAAHAIHRGSNRSDGPFVCMNCAAITDTLLESELFGHEKGAFTGATKQKLGKFEQANGGTLFLDEVAEMSLQMQSKFLRLLENCPFERLGGSKSIQVDVRVVAATSCSLEKMVRDGQFRVDLFHRLNVLSIHLPALRDHASDIRLLAHWYLETACRYLGKPVPQIADESFQQLEKHQWTGNVRELKNTMDRLAVQVDRPLIQPRDLCLAVLDGQEPSQTPGSKFSPVTLMSVERDHILRTLNHVGWKKKTAANLLGINRSTLDRKLERFGLHPESSVLGESGAQINRHDKSLSKSSGDLQ